MNKDDSYGRDGINMFIKYDLLRRIVREEIDHGGSSGMKLTTLKLCYKRLSTTPIAAISAKFGYREP